jgi:hypothetical protein
VKKGVTHLLCYQVKFETKMAYFSRNENGVFQVKEGVTRLLCSQVKFETKMAYFQVKKGVTHLLGGPGDAGAGHGLEVHLEAEALEALVRVHQGRAGQALRLVAADERDLEGFLG